MYREWIINNDEKLKNKPFVERLLATRGITKLEEIKVFLNPLDTELTQPNVFTGMSVAVERLAKAIDGQEKILVYGDFDADGVTSTALLLRTFRELGANVDYFIPDRDKESHGLNSKALVKLMTVVKPKVIVTCDCASSDVEQVRFLNSFKIDVIITDHHETPSDLPAAFAIINPKAPNALDESLSAKRIEYLTSLAGVGVAFKLAQALLEYYKKLEFIYDIMPYVTIGTIADVVPLVGENRYFVAKGLQLISSGKHYGIKRLLENAGYVLEQGITSEQIAFGVAPRINASGRLDTVEDAVKVLVSDNKQEIEMAIISLNNFNKVRQELCDSTFLEAEEMLKTEGNDENAIILFNPKWHIGIVGIVASKLVEKYYKPTFLMTYSEETKQIRCSSRGVSGLNIYDILTANEDLFDGFGGHSMAGGLSFSQEKVSFEHVKKALNKTVNESLGGRKLLPSINIDLQLEPCEVDGNLISDIERLQPFGAGNPNPIFVLNNLTLLNKKLMGSNKNHLKLILEDTQHNTFNCIWWSKGDISLKTGERLDIAFCPQTNTYNGSTTIQLILKDMHADGLEEDIQPTDNKNNEMKIYDHRKKTGIFSSVDDYVRTSNLNISIFAEDKSVLEKLKFHKALTQRIITRQTAQKADVVMFFDYPPSPDIFDELLKKTAPKFIHFMKYETKKIDEKEILKTFSGMLKFAYNNKNGIFDIERCASFLALTKEAVIELLNVFVQCEMLGLKDDLAVITNSCKIQFIKNSEISKALHTVAYMNFLSQVNEVFEYKKTFQEVELSRLF